MLTKQEKMRHIFLVFLLLSTVFVKAQSLDEETGFRYVKAEYLVSTQRFDDAIRELNEIIKIQPGFKEALILRGETKFTLAAYKGAKEDALQYIDIKGISLEAATLLGRSEYAMAKMPSALNSLTVAIALGSKDEKVYVERAQILLTNGKSDEACADWEKAIALGSTTAAINYTKYCKSKPSQVQNPPMTQATNPSSTKETTQLVEPTSDEPIDKVEKPESNTAQNESTASNNPVTQPIIETPSKTFSIDESKVPQEDNTPNDIVIDEELTLSILGQGLGNRRVLERPSILILSDTEGVMAVEICVNENGRVDYSEFQAAKSTIDTKSLVSLAVRKAKDFWFEKSDFPKQCGYIYFKIKSSN